MTNSSQVARLLDQMEAAECMDYPYRDPKKVSTS
jgi:hypothetical protein